MGPGFRRDCGRWAVRKPAMPLSRGRAAQSRIVKRPAGVFTGGHATACRRLTGTPSDGQREDSAMVEIRRMGPQIGVEVRGVDVKTLDDAGFAPIYQAWLYYNILCVRGQDLAIPDFIRYSERFGPVTPHPSKSTRHPEFPKITMLGVNKFDAAGKLRDEIYRRGAEGWHTDGAYNQAPFKATQLYARSAPPRPRETASTGASRSTISASRSSTKGRNNAHEHHRHPACGRLRRRYRRRRYQEAASRRRPRRDPQGVAGQSRAALPRPADD